MLVQCFGCFTVKSQLIYPFAVRNERCVLQKRQFMIELTGTLTNFSNWHQGLLVEMFAFKLSTPDASRVVGSTSVAQTNLNLLTLTWLKLAATGFGSAPAPLRLRSGSVLASAPLRLRFGSVLASACFGWGSASFCYSLQLASARLGWLRLASARLDSFRLRLGYAPWARLFGWLRFGKPCMHVLVECATWLCSHGTVPSQGTVPCQG